MEQAVTIEVITGDALTVDADILALKYAQASYGVDKRVAQMLLNSRQMEITPRAGGFRLVTSEGAVAAKSVLFIGVPELYEFGYREIREFSIRVLSSLAGEAPEARVVALTIHGPGYGLDEGECFLSEIAGLADAIASGDYPAKLAVVKIVEQNEGRARRLRQLLDAYLPEGRVDVDTQILHQRIGEERSGTLRAIGYDSAQKPHIFTAMPFADEAEDLFHYGIQQAVTSNGYLCERIDQIPAVGDILARIKERIETAEFVVAEMTGANPNVYLEVGYAWGRDVPTVLLIKEDEVKNLRFDVAGQRCIVYSSIRDLEKKLSSELASLARQIRGGRREFS
jgi:hypothetical protein